MPLFRFSLYDSGSRAPGGTGPDPDRTEQELPDLDAVRREALRLLLDLR